MPIRVNDVSSIESFEEVIPKASHLGDHYLRAVASGIQEYEPPVTMALDEIITGGFRSPNIECLVVQPTKDRIRHYKTAHYAVSVGGSLRVGWHLVGGERAAGIGFLGIGAATQNDVDEVLSIVHVIQTYAVLPAIQSLVDSIQYGNRPSGGFLGI